MELFRLDESKSLYKDNPNYSGFVVIGAGLPRTGTLSTRHALSYLLNGPIYHMEEVFSSNDVSNRWYN